MTLAELGWNAFFADAFEPHREQNLRPARVAVQHRGAYVLFTEEGELRVAAARSGAAVGDWVATDGESVRAVLPRRSAFRRHAAGAETEEQVVAANVDTVFLVSALGDDLNARRVERYLTMAWESGAAPAVVLTKTDTGGDVPGALAEVESVAFGVPVHAVSSVTGEGLEALGAYLKTGRTVALLGSSGVGKSTLLNRLVGYEALATQELRRDGKGRHTTTHRELVLVPGGGLVLDTPGMRELQLWEAGEGLERTFEDILALAANCRFSDCAHEAEPGCAVRDVVDPARLESYRKLERELHFLGIKHDQRLRSEERKRWKAVHKILRTTKY